MDNPNNKLITKNDIITILNYFQPIGDNGTNLEPLNLEYYQRAFVHESYFQSIQNNLINENIHDHSTYISYIPEESNERLEYLGDSILKSTISRYLFDRYGETREGFLTKLKIKIEKCFMLHKFGLTLGFKQYLLLSLQVENQSILDMFRGRSTISFYEDAFEAFIGSIMLDFGEYGYIYADRFVRSLIENIVDFSELISVNDNNKDQLQRSFQSHKFPVPKYITLTESGPLYRKVFTRITCISSDQFDFYPPHIRDNIDTLNQTLLASSKISDPSVYQKLLDIRLNNNYVLNVGFGKKIIEAEQDCAKNCMSILEIPSNF